MAQRASHRGLSLDPLHPNIQQLVEKYENFNDNNKSQKIVQEIHGRTPWILMSSNAIVGGVDGKKYQLLGDWMATTETKMANKRVGVWHKATGDKDGTGNFMYYGGKSRLMPKAGITEFNVDSKGGLGSIRYGKIKIKAFTADDLAYIEKYYMVPGLRVLIQWGWSSWEGDVIDLWDSRYENHNGEIYLQQDILKRVVGVKSLYDNVPDEGEDKNTPGRYDAMIGVVTKFNWSIDEGGAYDIDIEVTSTNGMLLTTPMDSCTLGAQLVTTKTTYEDNYGWPFGPGDKTYSNVEGAKMIPDIEAVLFQLENSSGKGTFTMEGGDDGWLDFDGSSETWNSVMKILNTEYAKGAFFGYGHKKKSKLGDAYRTPQSTTVKHHFRPILTKEAAKQGSKGWGKMVGNADRTIIRGPHYAREHQHSWSGYYYGFQGTISDTEIGEIQSLWGALKLETWVSWRFIEDVLLNFIAIPKNGDGLPVVGINSTHEVLADEFGYNGWSAETSKIFTIDKSMQRKRYLSNQCLNHPHLRSVNPEVCFLPGQQGFPCKYGDLKSTISEWADGRLKDFYNVNDLSYWAANFGNKHHGIPSDVDGSGFYQKNNFAAYATGGPSFLKWASEKDVVDTFATNKEHTAGYIRNIMVNTKFIAETYRNNPSMQGFINGLLEGINKACGEPWEFVLRANPNDNGLLQVTDNNIAEGLAKAKAKGLKVYQLKSNNVKSIITNVQITSKLPDAMKNAAFSGMCAAEPSESSNPDNIIFRMYGAGIEDRFTKYAKKERLKQSGADEEELKKKKAALEKIEKYDKQGGPRSAKEISDYKAQAKILGYNAAFPPDLKRKVFSYAYWYSVATGKQSDRTAAQDAQKEYLKDVLLSGEDQGLQTAMLPIELSFDMLGMSGFWMGNAITLASNSQGGLLPDRYAGTTIFQVSKVNHKVGRESWKTSVECMMRQTNEAIPKSSKPIIKVDPTSASGGGSYSQPGDYKPPAAKGEASEYLNYDSVAATYKKLGYVHHEDGKLNLTGIRIANLARSGVGSKKGSTGYLDYFCMTYKDGSQKVFEAYPCTTVPGTSVLTRVNSGNPTKAWAILKPGFYKSWYHGTHKSSPPNYRAGTQARGNVSVYRDGNRDLVHDLVSNSVQTGYYGINIHRSHESKAAWRVGNYSWGCQVFLNNGDFQRMRAQISRNPIYPRKKSKGYEEINYALIDEGDMILKKDL